jgi:hypothetical protein
VVLIERPKPLMRNHHTDLDYAARGRLAVGIDLSAPGGKSRYAPVPPPVPSIAAPPQAALNAIAQLQSMILQSTPDGQPDTMGDTRRTIGLTDGSLLIVDGGVRLPK